MMLQTINDSCNKISFQFTELFLKPNAMIFHSLKTELSLIYVKLNDSIERERERERDITNVRKLKMKPCSQSVSLIYCHILNANYILPPTLHLYKLVFMGIYFILIVTLVRK